MRVLEAQMHVHGNGGPIATPHPFHVCVEFRAEANNGYSYSGVVLVARFPGWCNPTQAISPMVGGNTLAHAASDLGAKD